MILKSSLQSDYNVTTSYDNITGLSITIPEDGVYHVIGNITCDNTAAADAQVKIKLAIDGTRILASGGDSFTASTRILTINPINNFVYLKKDQVVTVQAEMGTSDSCVVYSTGADHATYIEAINLTKLARGGM